MNTSIILYLLNSISHEASLIGYRIPLTGSHSVIESPESEILVYPPIKIIDTTESPSIISHIEKLLILLDNITK